MAGECVGGAPRGYSSGNRRWGAEVPGDSGSCAARDPGRGMRRLVYCLFRSFVDQIRPTDSINTRAPAIARPSQSEDVKSAIAPAPEDGSPFGVT